MKKFLYFTIMSSLLTTPVLAYETGESLSGDTKLACEAVLCLSLSARPSECSPSLDRYFGIKHKYLSDTINARINFLNLCPAHNEPNMPSLISAIAHGAGRCDAEYLNRFNKETYYEKVCTRSYNHDDGTSCKYHRVTVISDKKPYYCTAYEHHEFTDLNTKYVGDKFNGGKWYDGKDYDKAMEEYKRQQSKTKKSISRSRRSNNVQYIPASSYERSQRDSR